jgi:hypothetical protein
MTAVRALLAALAASFALLPVAARADGVMRVQQSDGAVQVYHDLKIRLAGHTVWIHSGDRKGVLEVASGACSFVRELQRCLPYATTLHQHGATRTIVLQQGTVYLNLTGDLQRLPHSSQQLLPHALLLFLHTMHGTYVSVKGTLDEVSS